MGEIFSHKLSWHFLESDLYIWTQAPGPAQGGAVLPSSLPSEVIWQGCTLCAGLGGSGQCCLLLLPTHLSKQALLLLQGLRGASRDPQLPWSSSSLETGVGNKCSHLTWSQPLCPPNAWFRSYLRICIVSVHRNPWTYGLHQPNFAFLKESTITLFEWITCCERHWKSGHFPQWKFPCTSLSPAAISPHHLAPGLGP